MNNFSFKRTGQLIKKQWVENRRLYSMSVLALLGALGIVMALWLVTGGRHYREDNLYVIGLIGLFISGAIFASTSFNMLNSKDTGIYWITFPASHFEKFLVTLFFNVIAFTIVYALCFFLLKFLAASYVEVLVSNAKFSSQYSYEKINWARVHGLGPNVPYFLLAFFAVQAAFLLGAASFKKLSFILTLIIISATVFLTIFYVFRLSKAMLPEIYNYNLTEVRSNEVDGIYNQYEMGTFLKAFIEIFLKYLLTPFLWLITWLKLKEKEI